MITAKKSLSFILIIQLFLFACSPNDGGGSLNNQQHPSSAISEIEPVAELTHIQSTAFDALNALQVRSGGQIYSTFVGSEQKCNPPDTTFVLSSAEFKIVLETLLPDCCLGTSIEERDKFFNEAVLAQDEYQVEQCHDFYSRQIDDEANLSIASGYWIIRAVLGRRDIILHW